jgi:hypothetical protein
VKIRSAHCRAAASRFAWESRLRRRTVGWRLIVVLIKEYRHRDQRDEVAGRDRAYRSARSERSRAPLSLVVALHDEPMLAPPASAREVSGKILSRWPYREYPRSELLSARLRRRSPFGTASMGMSGQARRRPLAIARVAVCLAALLSQGTLLPLAHTAHELSAATDDGASRGAASGATETVRRRSPASPTHDASRCLLCAAFAHSRSGIVSLGVGAPAPFSAPEVLAILTAVWSGTASPAVARPRAPPSLAA